MNGVDVWTREKTIEESWARAHAPHLLLLHTLLPHIQPAFAKKKAEIQSVQSTYNDSKLNGGTLKIEVLQLEWSWRLRKR